MKLQQKIIKASSLEDLPNLQAITSMPRGLKLKVIFEKELKIKRKEIGEQWKQQLSKFLIGIHTQEDEINILKLITDEEIEQHQSFFEDAAREYGQLGAQLIQQFMKEFKVKSHEGFPLKTLNPYDNNSPYQPTGKMGEWQYWFHGFHLAFTHQKMKQHLEVPLTFGEEYGELDPYFFAEFIKTTPKFRPLPVPIYDDYWDGKRILEVMLNLGKFEKINSNLKGRKGIIIKNRIKKEVKIFDEGIGEVF